MSIDIEHDDKEPGSYKRPEPYKQPHNNKAMAGIILMIVGVIFLLNQLNFFFFPSWPIILIVVGLYFGVRHNFRNAIWLILVIIGGINLLEDIFPRADFSNAIFPLIIIAIGIRMITNRNKPWNINRWNRKWDKEQRKAPWDNMTAQTFSDTAEPTPGFTKASDDTNRGDYYEKYKGYDDYLDATSVFSGVKKKILSKNFKGGEIVNFFGGCDVDFSMADINGRVIIDVTQVFGGIKLIVPPHWHVTSDMMNLFAGFDDKRMQKNDYGSDKILILTGTSIFAGVEIRNY